MMRSIMADMKFVHKMILHHEMALEMANSVIAEGRDPEIAALAKGIIQAQAKEIAFMRRWMARAKIGMAGAKLDMLMKSGGMPR